MELSNHTTADARFKISVNGCDMPHDPGGEAVHWPVLEAGAVISQSPAPPGPWRIDFYVEGLDVTAELASESDQVDLVWAGGTFRAEVRRVVPLVGSVRRLFGLLNRPGLRAPTVQEMTESMAESIAEDNDRIRRVGEGAGYEYPRPAHHRG